MWNNLYNLYPVWRVFIRSGNFSKFVRPNVWHAEKVFDISGTYIFITQRSWRHQKIRSVLWSRSCRMYRESWTASRPRWPSPKPTRRTRSAKSSGTTSRSWPVFSSSWKVRFRRQWYTSAVVHFSSGTLQQLMKGTIRAAVVHFSSGTLQQLMKGTIQEAVVHFSSSWKVRFRRQWYTSAAHERYDSGGSGTLQQWYTSAAHERNDSGGSGTLQQWYTSAVVHFSSGTLQQWYTSAAHERYDSGGSGTIALWNRCWGTWPRNGT